MSPAEIRETLAHIEASEHAHEVSLEALLRAKVSIRRLCSHPVESREYFNWVSHLTHVHPHKCLDCGLVFNTGE